MSRTNSPRGGCPLRRFSAARLFRSICRWGRAGLWERAAARSGLLTFVMARPICRRIWRRHREAPFRFARDDAIRSTRDHAMPSKLDQLKQWTIVTADTGDIGADRAYKPQDCTTNPTPHPEGGGRCRRIRRLSRKRCVWGRSHSAATSRIAAASFGQFRRGADEARARPRIDRGRCRSLLRCRGHGRARRARSSPITDQRGVGRERVLIKIAATWEGIKAASILQKEAIDCNLTLIFSLAQAAPAPKPAPI